MPHYVRDPDTGKPIAVTELLKRDPFKALLPDMERIMPALMRRDTWTRGEALLILSGYQPNTSTAFVAGNTVPFQPAYLDGTTWGGLQQTGLSHPRELDALGDYLVLTGYAAGGALEERKTPAEWLEWAEKKGFVPYWISEMPRQNEQEQAGRLAARRSAGRYTLREAANEIAHHAHGDRREALRKLKTAWKKKNLAVFEPDSTLSCESSRLHPDYLESIWSDLNAWLEINEPRITWRFPAPDFKAALLAGEWSKASAEDKRKMVSEALRKCAENQTQAAKSLGITRQNLQRIAKTITVPRSCNGGATVAAHSDRVDWKPRKR
ncbi:MAG: hypothetical protein M0Z84_07745 [Gammaproteobacteria bacterium]|nr:hypothetical protein [Gammaproteobacteria bacterium]